MSVIQLPEAILRYTVGAFAFQTNFYQRIRIVYGGIRIGDDPVQSDKPIHILFPAFVFGFLENLYFLSAAKNHVISPN